MNIILAFLLFVTSIFAYENFCEKNIDQKTFCSDFEENAYKNNDIINQPLNPLVEKLFVVLKSAKYSSLVVKRVALSKFDSIPKWFSFYLIDFYVLDNEKTLNCRAVLSTFYTQKTFSVLSGYCNETDFYVTNYAFCNDCKCCWSNTHQKF